MNIKNSLTSSFKTLAKNKMRSGLTSIGIIIGVSSVIVMIGLGSSAQIAVRDKIWSYGVNAMSIVAPPYMFTANDLVMLKKTFPQIKYISPVCFERNIILKYRQNKLKARLFGVNNDYFNIKERQITTGRLFTADEVFSTAKVAIIGTNILKELFASENPISQQIVINDVPYKIIGILEEMGESLTGNDYDNEIIIPYTTANAKIWNRINFPEIYLSVHSDKMINDTKEQVYSYLRKKFYIPDGKDDEFRILTSKEKLKMADDISGALSILLAGIASISLFVGGVGIMNIMLVSVTERTREIGIRMAIGARKRDILMQFLVESVMLSSIGGVIGITIGLIIYYIITKIAAWPFIFSIGAIFISVLFASVVGIFFGYYPAKKASALKPIEALKFE
jgi:putative ABC transport system permease protein